MRKFTWLVLVLLTSLISQSIMAQKSDLNYGQNKIENAEAISKVTKASKSVGTYSLGPVIYEQIDNMHYDKWMGSTFVPDSKTYSTQMADDFIVPTGETWSLNTVAVYGMNKMMTYANSTKVSVFIFADAEGMPKDTLHQFEVTDFAYDEFVHPTNSIYNYIRLYVNIPVTDLTEGTYWVTVQPHYNFDDNMFGVFVLENDNAIGNEYAFRNPGGDFNNLYTNWTSYSDIESLDKVAGAPDMNFAFYEAPKANDLAVTGLVAPGSNADLTATEVPIVNIRNYGLTEQSAYTVKILVDGVEVLSEDVNEALAAGATTEYAFHGTIDLSAVKAYDVTAKVILAGDEAVANDEVVYNVYNYGTVYTVEAQKELAVCEGTLVDRGGLFSAPSDSYMKDTITIKPGEFGKMVRLHFVEHNNGNLDFKVWDGENTDAPLIGNFKKGTLNGEILTAANQTGALTILSYSSNSYSGFVARISCEALPANDFEVKEVNVGSFDLFVNTEVSVSAVLRNLGTANQGKDVDLIVNGVVVETKTSNAIGFAETDVVEFLYTPATAEELTIEVAVAADEGTIENNSLTINKTVYNEGQLVENFEGEVFPPLGWSVKLGALTVYNADPELGCEGDYAVRGSRISDTLVAPKVVIEAGDKLEWKYYSGVPFYTTRFSVMISDSPNGPWEVLWYMPITWPSFGKESVDLSDHVGEKYIAFEVMGNGGIDAVKGPQIFYFNNDLAITKFTSVPTPVQNGETTIDAEVKNLGKTTVAAGAYTVNFYKEIDGVSTELTSIAGEEIGFLKTKVYSYTHTYTEVENGKVYAEIVFETDEDASNNSSAKQNLYVQTEGTSLYGRIGAGDTYRSMPIEFNEYKNVVSEFVYKSNDIGTNYKRGVMSGISLFTNVVGKDDVQGYVEVFAVETTEETLLESWVPAGDMYPVFKGELNFEAGEMNELYIPFEKPMLYAGGNMVFMFFMPEAEERVYPRFYGESDELNYYARHKAANTVDIYDVDVLNSLNYTEQKFRPDVRIFLNHQNTNAKINGTVADTSGNLLEKALIKIDNYVNDFYTDANGYYSYNYLPLGDYGVTANAFGYYDSTRIETFAKYATTTVDFGLIPIANVAITGTLVRDDNGDPIADATITVKGYNEYSATSDANGYFQVDDIFVANEYELTVEAHKFNKYLSIVNVAEDTLKLGAVTLDEIEKNVVHVLAKEVNDTVRVSWEVPYTGQATSIVPFDEFHENWYTAEPNSQEQLGNKFVVNKPTTFTSFYFRTVELAADLDLESLITLDIYDADRNLLLQSEPFSLENEAQWIYVDVPDFSTDTEIYAMLHWNNRDKFTNGMAWDTDAENIAYYIDSYGNWSILSDVINSDGAFFLMANTIEEDPAIKALESYNIYRTTLENAQLSENWTKLNTEAITTTAWTDSSWIELDSAKYIYMVEGIYTNGISEVVYSTVVSSGVYVNVDFNITTNSGVSSEGAKVSFINKDGNELNAFTAEADVDGKVNFPRVMKGEYDLKVNKVNFDMVSKSESIYSDLSSDIELTEKIFDPTNLIATVSEDAPYDVNMSWALGEQNTITMDDGTNEEALFIQATGEGGIGNMFKTDNAGQILSFDVFGVENGSTTEETNETLIMQIYNANQELVAKSDEFKLMANEWVNITIPSVPYEGDFYGIVNWSTDTTYALAIDVNTIDYGYLVTELGFSKLSDVGYPGTVLLRANVIVSGKGTETLKGAGHPASTVNSEILNRIESKGKPAAPKAEKASAKFNIYVNDLTSPLYTDVNTTQYELVTADFNANGENTVGVSAVYATGESNVITTTVNVLGVGVNDVEEISCEVYPNPATDYIKVQVNQPSVLNIFDTKGALVKTVNVSAGIETVDVSNLETGSYMMQIENANNKINKNLIIAR